MSNTQQMIGSEKQIAWATQIKAGWFTALDNMVADATARVGYGDFAPAYITISEQIANEFKGKIDTWTAKEIIDRRNHPVRQAAEHVAFAKYQEVK